MSESNGSRDACPPSPSPVPSAALNEARTKLSPVAKGPIDYELVADLVAELAKGNGQKHARRPKKQDPEARPSATASSGAGGANGAGASSSSSSSSKEETEKAEAPGAILIFLPGLEEIKAQMRSLRAHSCGPRLFVVPLHSSLASQEQRRAFYPPPSPQLTKVVVATNIAETSITIEDVVHVIDCGRVKEARYRDGMSCLETVWCSLAACKQRAGRAGRTRAGKCWRIFPREWVPTTTTTTATTVVM